MNQDNVLSHLSCRNEMYHHRQLIRLHVLSQCNYYMRWYRSCLIIIICYLLTLLFLVFIIDTYRFTAGLGYYGLNFNVANLTGSIYINNLISGAVEIPAALIFFLSQYLGRKSLSITSLFLGSLSLIAVAVMSVYFDLKQSGNPHNGIELNCIRV